MVRQPDDQPAPDDPMKRPRIPRGSLSEEVIALAALRLLARDGVAGLTMRGVAQELGAAPMSLYRHVAGHEALVELVRGRVMAPAAVPPVDPRQGWRETLRGLLHGGRAQLRRHPGAVVLFNSDSFRHPPAPLVVEQALTCLVRAGIRPERLATTSAALWMFTVGSVLAEQSSAAAWPGEEIAPPRRKAWAAGMRTDIGRIAPQVAAETASWVALSHDQVFAEGLELLLGGLEPHAPARSFNEG